VFGDYCFVRAWRTCVTLGNMSTRTIAERLDRLLPQTRAQVAEQLGVTRVSLWRWEHGKQPAPAWLDLALRWLAHEQTRKRYRRARSG
jgi:transcriptional regulator with XRE-family HTH domain